MRIIFFQMLILSILFASCRGKTVVFDDSEINRLTEHLIIETNDSLIIKPGAEILIDTGINILAYGPVLIQGTKERPVKIKASNPEFGWGELRAKGECPSLIIENAEIEEGSRRYRATSHLRNPARRHGRVSVARAKRYL